MTITMMRRTFLTRCVCSGSDSLQEPVTRKEWKSESTTRAFGPSEFANHWNSPVLHDDQAAADTQMTVNKLVTARVTSCEARDAVRLRRTSKPQPLGFGMNLDVEERPSFWVRVDRAEFVVRGHI